MEELRGHLLGDESIFTFTRGCADFRDPTAVFRFKDGLKIGCEISKLCMDRPLDLFLSFKPSIDDPSQNSPYDRSKPKNP